MITPHDKIDTTLKNDTTLSQIIEQVSLHKIESTNNVFHDLIGCVIEQQIHYRSTKKQFHKLLNLSGITELSIDNFQIFEKYLTKNSKLSERKYSTISNVIEYFSNHNTDWLHMSDQDIRATLKEIQGIGNWTIEMILIYTLKREDAFSHEDYHIKQIMSKLYGITTKSNAALQKEILNLSTQWSPFRSFAFRYLLEYKKSGFLS